MGSDMTVLESPRITIQHDAGEVKGTAATVKVMEALWHARNCFLAAAADAKVPASPAPAPQPPEVAPASQTVSYWNAEALQKLADSLNEQSSGLSWYQAVFRW